MGKRKGSVFETQTRKALKKVCWVMRIPDASQKEKFLGEKTPCDFLAVTPTQTIFIECKTIARTSLPFYNIKQHQIDHLCKLSSCNPSVRGYFLIRFKEPHQRDWVAHLIPALAIRDYIESKKRKSFTKTWCKKNGKTVYRREDGLMDFSFLLLD